MKQQEIIWNENGWTVIQEADAEQHILEISCLAENGQVVEVRKRHNDGEEEKLTRHLDAAHDLPMALNAFQSAIERKEITLK